MVKLQYIYTLRILYLPLKRNSLWFNLDKPPGNFTEWKNKAQKIYVLHNFFGITFLNSRITKIIDYWLSGVWDGGKGWMGLWRSGKMEAC